MIHPRLSLLKPFIICILVYGVAIGANTAVADKGKQAVIPTMLTPWQDWVLRDQAEYNCIRIAQTPEQKRCTWPEVLNIETSNSGAHFNQGWQVLARQWIYLPGSREHWPHDVTINGDTAVVVDHKGKPAIQVAQGNYRIKGQ